MIYKNLDFITNFKIKIINLLLQLKSRSKFLPRLLPRNVSGIIFLKNLYGKIMEKGQNMGFDFDLI